MRGELSPLTSALPCQCIYMGLGSVLFEFSFPSDRSAMLISKWPYHIQYSKMLLVDRFKISILNDQITNVILEFQSSKGKQDRTRLDHWLISSLIRVFIFIIQNNKTGKDQAWIQLSTIPGPGHPMRKWQIHKKTSNARELRGQPDPNRWPQCCQKQTCQYG